MVLDLGVHDFDQLGLLLGVPEAVEAIELPGGTVQATVEYGGGAVGQVVTGFGMPAAFPFTTSLEVLGELGIARYSFTAPGAGPVGGSVLEVVTVDGRSSAVVDPGDPFADQARYFLDCIASGNPPVDGSAEGALAALTLALAARTSLRTGARVPVAAARGAWTVGGSAPS
jgi:predicted dehydrogenase